MTDRKSFIFNHGNDLEKGGDPCELIYREVDQFKPQSMICGSHHIVLLSKQGPKNEFLDMSSVLIISPRGSTIPLTLYEDLKKKFPNLAAILQVRQKTITLCLNNLLYLITTLTSGLCHE